MRFPKPYAQQVLFNFADDSRPESYNEEEVNTPGEYDYQVNIPKSEKRTNLLYVTIIKDGIKGVRRLVIKNE